ncbi:aminomethyl-transferring glycine dehydrogenase subunit GcvPA [Hazenella sp. IB182357]|uniref:Probable glycine dehydrogenase (decarboxylating) subunit 1 n=1 Tax=Polycladospora coralii TaxID=2771432 RepID=A0A926RTW7_9BACL|nr:aminomethyl-transferring glycine dehydrogenase subunit GcvPA [Polycladospora coralii]MBD1371669.1 aminomethyl-transferring glycine dehydrogenase subunit GcvPA [Polycladospora coralii]MBS7529136.1 aminomethyl-transferring glycine dehydrogenase subunit GcvPA [Polycladospora coralii]
MKHRYMPMTEQNRQDMLKTIGVKDIEELFSEIPASVRYQGRLPLAEPLAEPELVKHMKRLANKNASFDTHVSFLGAGVYEHYIPSVVGHVISRSEFYTAYTPYQPEISQGELQAMFEFQTMICQLTGMDVANSSMYDGSTALAEAASMASAITKLKKIVISRAVHPEAREILHTNAKGLGLEIIEIDTHNGVTDIEALSKASDEQTAAVVVQSPNFFGAIEDLAEIEKIAHAHKGLFVVSTNPLSLGLLKPPGEYAADIVVGDAQPLGIGASFGGPHCGFFTTTKKYMRRIPGRIVGQTVDEDGVRGFVLTLQAREQHIRRDKATSNICSNQALNAIAAAVYMSALGKQGIKEVAERNFHKAHYASKRLSQVRGVEIVSTSPFFNEFVMKLSRPVSEMNEELLAHGILGGYDLSRDYPELKQHMLVAITEMRTKEEMDHFADVLEGLL